MKKVLIIQRVIPSYRVPFYKNLERSLLKSNVSLDIVAGQPWKKEAFSDDREKLDFIVMSKNIPLLGSLYWQTNVIKLINKYDLVIFEQANSALVNLFIFLRRYIYGKPIIAFWGHGADLNKVRRNQFKDKWKGFLTTKVDHWFAYTDLTKKILKDRGYSESNTTVVYNSIDTEEIRRIGDSISQIEKDELFEATFNKKYISTYEVGVFCGRLTKLKHIDFLLSAIKDIKIKRPNFYFIIIGDGVENNKVSCFIENNPWCVWLGSLYGEEKIRYLKLGKLWLNPGMTGLAVLDAFALGMPFITRKNGIHSPEISYLESGRNGLLTNESQLEFTESVIRLLETNKIENLAKEAYKDGLKFSIEFMSQNFKEGILSIFKNDNHLGKQLL